MISMGSKGAIPRATREKLDMPRESLLTMQEVMKITRIKCRTTFYKIIIPLDLKRQDPEKYRNYIGYKNINPNGKYEKRRFPSSEVKRYIVLNG